MNTKATRRIIDDNNIITFVGDLTAEDAELERLLEKLGGSKSGGLPHYVIFPAGKPEEWVHFGGTITTGGLAEKLKKAGPSKVTDTNESTAMRLPWEPFSTSKLHDYRDQGFTVLVDFTADWSVVCKVNEAVALNTAKTKRLVDMYNVKTLKADKTGDAHEVDALLKKLGNEGKTIPYYAIYPAGGGEPIHFGNRPITSDEIVETLKKAGPSKVNGEGESTAMR